MHRNVAVTVEGFTAVAVGVCQHQLQGAGAASPVDQRAVTVSLKARQWLCKVSKGFHRVFANGGEVCLLVSQATKNDLRYCWHTLCICICVSNMFCRFEASGGVQPPDGMSIAVHWHTQPFHGCEYSCFASDGLRYHIVKTGTSQWARSSMTRKSGSQTPA